jgi:Tfp pilus assembly protein PilZ
MEHRRSVRQTLRIPVRLYTVGGLLADSTSSTVNLSERGVLLETDAKLNVGANVVLQLKLLEEFTGQPTTEWRCKGHVVRATPTWAGSRTRLGISFDSLDAYCEGAFGSKGGSE